MRMPSRSTHPACSCIVYNTASPRVGRGRREAGELASFVTIQKMNVAIQYNITGTNASEIVASLEEGIRTGRMPQGTSLPPVRTLATALHVSPTTVAAAYRTLQQRGLLTAQGRRGTRVSLRPPLGLY